MGICKDFMYRRCTRKECKYEHNKDICFHYWKGGDCKFGDTCKKLHTVRISVKTEDLCQDYSKTGLCKLGLQCGKLHVKSSGEVTNVEEVQYLHSGEKVRVDKVRVKFAPRRKKMKNTECFEPMTKPVDMRIIYDLSVDELRETVTSRDVVLVPNAFGGYRKGELYNRLVSEINSCNIPKDQLLKLWHGNDKIEGTHLIANDRTRWKESCPTFDMVVKKIADYFKMDVKATRFNWYTDTSQWKPFHHDSAYVDPAKAAVQNFTVAVSFGATRDAAFEDAKTKTVISLPQADGVMYAFAKDTNILWRHGILQDMPVRDQGRISVICWGYVDGQVSL